MKKILLTLVLLILFIPGVNAEEIKFPLDGMGISNSCSKNLLKADFSKFVHADNDWLERNFSYTGPDYPINAYFIQVEPNTTYFYSSNFNSVPWIYEFDENLKQTSYIRVGANNSFITKETTKYINIGFYTKFDIILNSEYYFQIELGAIGTEYVEYIECSNEPVNPEPTPLPADVTLDSFYTICIEKIVELSNFTIENKFILFAFSIIIFFTIIGLFIHLFKGGRRQ